MNQRKYVEMWENNALQHYNDKDYAWIGGIIKPYQTILEVGCGAGYSTLSMAENGHSVLAIDANLEALKRSRELLVGNGYKAEIANQYIDFSEADIWLWNLDVVSSRETIITVFNQISIDLILLCNPGGNLDKNLYNHEVELLLQYGFTQKEIDYRYQQKAIPLLHKFAMIDAAADIAIKSEKPLFIVDRGSEDQAKKTLEQIALDTHMRKVFDDYRKIKDEPENGISLDDVDEEIRGDLFWGAGMFFPD